MEINLTKEQIEHILTIINNTGFRGAEVEIVAELKKIFIEALNANRQS